MWIVYALALSALEFDAEPLEEALRSLRQAVKATQAESNARVAVEDLFIGNVWQFQFGEASGKVRVENLCIMNCRGGGCIPWLLPGIELASFACAAVCLLSQRLGCRKLDENSEGKLWTMT